MITVAEIRTAVPDDSLPVDVIVLEYEEKWVRRKVLTAQHGNRIAIDLPELRSLQDRERIITSDNAQFEIIAAEEHFTGAFEGRPFASTEPDWSHS